MSIALLTLRQLRGGELWFAGWLVCAAAYFGLLLARKRCRTGAACKNIVFWFLAAEVLSDAGWALYYWFAPGAFSFGVGLVYGLPLWLLTLAAAAWAAARQNRA